MVANTIKLQAVVNGLGPLVKTRPDIVLAGGVCPIDPQRDDICFSCLECFWKRYSTKADMACHVASSTSHPKFDPLNR